MPLNSEWFQARADELRAEEEAAARELEGAETTAERERLEARIAALEERAETAESRAAELEREEEPELELEEPDPEPDPEPTRRTRPGRKRGELYQEEPGGIAQVWGGDDEPDEVELEPEPAAAA